jgi:hypothetical protein
MVKRSARCKERELGFDQRSATRFKCLRVATDMGNYLKVARTPKRMVSR